MKPLRYLDDFNGIVMENHYQNSRNRPAGVPSFRVIVGNRQTQPVIRNETTIRSHHVDRRGLPGEIWRNYILEKITFKKLYNLFSTYKTSYFKDKKTYQAEKRAFHDRVLPHRACPQYRKSRSATRECSRPGPLL